MPNETANPTREEACFRELAEWFGENRKPIPIRAMRKIVGKFFPSTEELEAFVDYMDSPEGKDKFKKSVRLEAWKRGITWELEESD